MSRDMTNEEIQKVYSVVRRETARRRAIRERRECLLRKRMYARLVAVGFCIVLVGFLIRLGV